MVDATSIGDTSLRPLSGSGAYARTAPAGRKPKTGRFRGSCSILCATIREKAFSRHILEQRLASHLVQHAPFYRQHRRDII
jgi:hypothetical protein